MVNDELCPHLDGDKKVRRSKIRKSIQRTVQTAKFESIVICDEFEEEIEWTSLEERQKKIINWESLLIQGFKRSFDNILQELGLSHKKAYFKNGIDDKDDKSSDLDTLDSIG